MKYRLGKLAIYLSPVLLLLVLMLLPGCKPTTAANTPAVLAPGYLNAADQQMGEILAGAHNFYNSIQSQVNAGTLTMGSTIKASFNDFAISLNAAQTVYLAYHNGQATQAQAQTAVNLVQSKQAALPLPGGAK